MLYLFIALVLAGSIASVTREPVPRSQPVAIEHVDRDQPTTAPDGFDCSAWMESQDQLDACMMDGAE